MTPSARSRIPARVGALLVAGALSACGAEAPRAEEVASGLVPGAASAPAALPDHVSQMARGLSASLGGRTVAVFDFPDLRGQVTELGVLVSEQLTTELVRTGAGQVLERKQVLQVLEELNLRKADLTTSEVAMAAQQLGASAIVVGSVSVVGRTVEVNARAVDVNGGNLLTADRFSFNADAELLRLAERRTAALAPGSAAGPAQAPAEPGALVGEATLGPVHATIGECRAASSEVTCTLTVTSETVDARLLVQRWDERNEVRDEGGNAYSYDAFTFGSENASEWSTLLVAREATPARFTLTGVPITMSRFTRVAVWTSIQIGQRHLNGELVFRNVPIVR